MGGEGKVKDGEEEGKGGGGGDEDRKLWIFILGNTYILDPFMA